METMKRRVKVTIEKEFVIEFTPAMFAGMSVEQYLAEFKKGLWDVETIDDVFKYAARMCAYYGNGTHDGLGLIGPDHQTYPRVPDVKFDEIFDESEEEVIEGGA